MAEARLLDIKDRAAFEKLLERKYHAKELKSAETDNRFLEALERSGKGRTRVYGYFNDHGELLSASGQYLWEMMSFYTMTWGLIHPRFSNTPFNKSVEESGARESFDVAVKYAETINRFQFFYGMTLKHFKTRRTFWLEKDSYLSTYYDRTIETVVKAGTIPEYHAFQQIIGFQPREQDIVIRTGRLKNKYIIDRLNRSKIADFSYEEIYGEK